MDQFPIVLVYNGIDHYCGTKPIRITFKEGVEELACLLKSAKLVCHNLTQSTNLAEIKNKLGIMSQVLSTELDVVDGLYQPPDPIEPNPKLVRLTPGQEVKAKTVQLDSFTKMHCNCGILFESKNELKKHKKIHKTEGWICSKEGCNTECKLGKTLKRHFRNKHMGQHRYMCLYCKFGRDTESLVLNHMAVEHTHQANFPCRNDPCHFTPRKVFRTAVHRKRHEDFCGAEKKYVCQFCEKKYKRKKSFDNHIYVVHSQVEGQGIYTCKLCDKQYQSNDSYRAHYRYGNCFKVLQGQVESESGEEEEGEKDQEQEDEEEEEESEESDE